MGATSYSVGDKTKEKIFHEAMRLFYRKGYEATTYDDISNAAGVNRALIIYHFKNKNNLGFQVLAAYFQNFRNAMGEIIKECCPDSVEREIIVILYAYYRLLRYENLNLFLVEMQNENIFRADLISEERYFFERLRNRRVEISEDTFHILMHMDYGIEREIIRMVYQHKCLDFIDHMVELESHMILEELGYSEKELDVILRDARQILVNYDILLEEDFKVKVKKI